MLEQLTYKFVQFSAKLGIVAHLSSSIFLKPQLRSKVFRFKRSKRRL